MVSHCPIFKIKLKSSAYLAASFNLGLLSSSSPHVSSLNIQSSPLPGLSPSGGEISRPILVLSPCVHFHEWVEHIPLNSSWYVQVVSYHILPSTTVTRLKRSICLCASKHNQTWKRVCSEKTKGFLVEEMVPSPESQVSNYSNVFSLWWLPGDEFI